MNLFTREMSSSYRSRVICPDIRAHFQTWMEHFYGQIRSWRRIGVMNVGLSALLLNLACAAVMQPYCGTDSKYMVTLAQKSSNTTESLKFAIKCLKY